jgi:hypothetical protein
MTMATTTSITTDQQIRTPLQVTSLGTVTTKQKAVIAIDFGTTYSGTARAYTSDPSHVNCASPASRSTGNVKEETVLLETPDTGWYFGKTAVDKFNELKDSDLRDYEDAHHDARPSPNEDGLRARGVHLYRFYKARLSTVEDGNFETVMGKSTAGHEHSLLDLVAKSLQFLGNFAFDELSQGFGACMGIQRDDVLWVVTVPAIWSDLAKLFMRKAAFLAGLIPDESSDLLLLSLEPECASISAHVEGSRHGLFQDGSVFMVVDCGGGTVDITCYKVATKDPLVMDGICQPTGGMWGGMFVDCQFEQFLKYLFGTNMYLGLERNWPLEVEEVKEKFRALKTRFNPNETAKLHRLSLAPLMRQDIRNQQGLRPLATLVMEYNTNFPEEIPFDFGNRQIKMRIETDATLVFTQEQMMKFFKPTVDQILDCVDGILHQSPEIQYIVLVGGYGSSPVLGDVFRTKYSNAPLNKVVLIPDTAVKPQAAIVHGAALYGLCTTVVRSRIVKYTYGVASDISWFEGCGFANDRAHWDDQLNEWLVNDVFSPIVRKGDEAKPGKPFQRGGYRSLYQDQRQVLFPIYRSRDYSPRFVSDEGCELLGYVKIDCRSQADTFTAIFTFAAEIRVEVIRCDGVREFKNIQTNHVM